MWMSFQAMSCPLVKEWCAGADGKLSEVSFQVLLSLTSLVLLHFVDDISIGMSIECAGESRHDILWMMLEGRRGGEVV